MAGVIPAAMHDFIVARGAISMARAMAFCEIPMVLRYVIKQNLAGCDGRAGTSGNWIVC